MRNWFLSLNLAITLSMIGLLAFLGRMILGLLHGPNDLYPVLELVTVALAVGWVWAMLAAIRGSRGGLIACLILVLLLDVLFALWQYYICPPSAGCIHNPWLDSWNSAQLISGLLAAIALVYQLRKKKAAS